MKKRIVLCADDYGQAEAVSGGIVELLCSGRLSATSCMVNMPGWREQSAWLQPFKDKVDIGLHLNLTEGLPCSSAYRSYVDERFMSLPKLLVATFSGSRKLSANVLEAEFDAQIDAFEDAMGCVPDFVDGHQHVHHLPLIRDVLASVFQKRLKRHGAYVRVAKQRINTLKAAVISLTGAGAFTEFLDLHGIQHNSSFAGIYPFGDAKKYPLYFVKFLQQSSDGGLIMCHPGLAGDDAADPLHASRVLEYQYLASDDFLADCAKMDVDITRFDLSR